jgi:hypothetical protein
MTGMPSRLSPTGTRQKRSTKPRIRDGTLLPQVTRQRAPDRKRRRSRTRAELTRVIILAHRNPLFAENRGEVKADIERRKAAIATFEAERTSVRKVVDGH